MNYIGRFKDIRSCDTYAVYLIGDTASTAYTEVLLSGDQPFVARYDTNKTPFEPIRTSTATIRLVHNNYLEDILSPVARSTQVKLVNETTNTIEWIGYLTPKVYDASYVDEYETFELEAADCLSSLQYVPYTDDTAYTKNIVTIKSVIDKACDDCGLLDGYYWDRSKKVGTKILLPDHLKISEQNWFYSDTDEPWDELTIVEEICRYLGLTCIQWKTNLYFVDYQVMHDKDWFTVTRYAKSTSYSQGSSSHTETAMTVTADSYLASNASISFEPVYNKCVVRANMYAIDNIIPDLFGDEYLTNRIDPDNFYANFEVTPIWSDETYTDWWSNGKIVGTYTYGYKPIFPTGLRENARIYDPERNGDKIVDDGDYRYFHRLYDHKYWESCYYDLSGTTVTPSASDLKSSNCTRNYMGGTIVDLGVVRNEYLSDYGQWMVPNKLDYTRYLCLCCKYDPKNTWFAPSDHPVHTGPYTLFRAKPGAISPCVVADNAFLVIDYAATWERYVDRNYINPDWIADQCGRAAGARGTCRRLIGNLYFKLKIGDKYWNGNSWQTGDSTFRVVVEDTSKEVDVWNTELNVLNNVSWDMFVNESGYKIPLSGVTLTDNIEFEVLRPGWQFMYNTGNPHFTTFYHYNAYCWLSKLSVKVVQTGDAEQEESDITYENDINDDAVNELNTITVKLTTVSDKTKASYSTVIYAGGTSDVPLRAVNDTSLPDTFNVIEARKPEENIVLKYVMQYKDSTKKIKANLGLECTPFTKVKAIDIYEPTQGYVVASQEIDYARGTQQITMIEKK